MKGIKNLGKAGILFILGLALGAAFSVSAKTINFGGSGDYSYFVSRIGINDSTPDALLSVNGTGSTPLILLGDRASVSTDDTGEKIIFRNMEELRFTDTNDWLYNSWAGIRYDQATARLFFGGAADRDFADDGTPPVPIDIILTGVRNVGISSSTPKAKLSIGGQSGTDGIMFPDGTLQTTAFSMAGNWYVPATRVSNGEFGNLTGGGDYTFPASLTISGLSGLGNRMMIVDSGGRISATTIPSFPSGSNGQTLRHNGTSWVASSDLINAGAIGISVTGNIGLGGQISFDRGPILAPAALGDGLDLTAGKFNFKTGNLEVVDGAYVWHSLNGTSYTSGTSTILTGVRLGGGIVTGFADTVVGMSRTVTVKGSTGTNCNLVFSYGVLTSTTCP